MNRVLGAALVCTLALSAASCSSDDDGPGALSSPAVTVTTSSPTSTDESTTDAPATTKAPTTTDAATTTDMPVDRPEGPASELTKLSDDGVVFIGSPVAHEPSPGYVQEEFIASGSASSYVLEGGELTSDGRWTLAAGQSAEYRTRLVVRRPEAAAGFSGVVVVEWLNVSGGVDADPEWTSLREEIVREGHAWVGMSAQAIGVEGGPVVVRVSDEIPGAENAGKGLRAIDPERYGDLVHPGDAFANDIFTQAARAVRTGDALGGLSPTTLVAAGESQSAFALVTYINGVHPLVSVFDGYFIHSRGASSFAVLSPGTGSADISSSLGGSPTIIRTDLDVPVFDVQAENDVVGIFGSHAVRQPDSDRFRLWEVAGTAHADRHLMGETTAEIIDCGAPINDGPMHVVVKAAFHHLVAWVVTGTAPPPGQLLELQEGDPVSIARDADGIAQGGVRTPPVDVPAQTLSGVAGPNPAAICFLSGSTIPIAPERLAEWYSSAEDYEMQFDVAIDSAVRAGVVLDADRGAIRAYAHPELITF